MSVRRLVALATLLAATLAPTTLAPPTHADAETQQSLQGFLPGFVTMVSESGDYIGGGLSRSYRDNISVSGGAGVVVVSAGPYSFEFAAPSGYSLTPGRYPGAVRYPFQELGEPGLSVSGDGRGCNEVSGWFTVLDLAPDRVWIAYEQHCEGGDAALFGEIRLGSSFDQDQLTVEAGVMSWPSEHPGVPVRPTPVRVANTGTTPTTVRSTIEAGANDFSIIHDACPQSLAPGASCTIHVGVTPSRPGVRLGLLQVLDDRGSRREVSLSTIGIPGRTEWHMSGEAGDWISGGRSYDYTPQQGALMGGGGTETRAWMSVDHAGDWWTASFEAPSGKILLPGQTYTGATRYPFNSGNAGLDVSGSGRGCNELGGEFTVHEATYDQGYLTSFRISFEQHCEFSAAALRGEVSWRAVDPDAPTPDTVAPSAVSDLTVEAGATTARLSWRNPTDADWVDTVVVGTPGTSPASMGRLLYDGRQQQATVTDLPLSGPYTLTVFTEDTSGNLSPLRSVTLPGGTTAPSEPEPEPSPGPVPGPASGPGAGSTGSTPPVTQPPEARAVRLVATRLSRVRFRFRARADVWAKDARGVLQRRTSRGWRRVGSRSFSDDGRMRITRRVPLGKSRYRLVVRLDDQRVISPAIRVRGRR
ncbi:hypothetical protein EXE58_12830 [Nocardioides seonyuensis]|uniref:Fibronectin type-III domain-containing protein n=1 Tax=Nocardioides seonyuensis TaxID=2518371 RepID=A0A4P7IG71_9ACTN|nr:hypothetical protein [Nocardioides seonyuensis]QBX56266.1 hypothetical protein EXE58_12830 [Nocardioides seonyuensis]